MKVIELLNKMANGEDTPEIIKFDGKIFTHNKTGINTNYFCDETNKILEDYVVYEELNDDVEIIEDTPKEDKKIEKLKILQFSDLIDMSKEEITQVIKEQRFKINEIIDKVNKGSEE